MDTVNPGERVWVITTTGMPLPGEIIGKHAHYGLYEVLLDGIEGRIHVPPTALRPSIPKETNMYHINPKEKHNMENTEMSTLLLNGLQQVADKRTEISKQIDTISRQMDALGLDITQLQMRFNEAFKVPTKAEEQPAAPTSAPVQLDLPLTENGGSRVTAYLASNNTTTDKPATTEEKPAKKKKVPLKDLTFSAPHEDPITGAISVQGVNPHIDLGLGYYLRVRHSSSPHVMNLDRLPSFEKNTKKKKEYRHVTLIPWWFSGYTMSDALKESELLKRDLPRMTVIEISLKLNEQESYCYLCGLSPFDITLKEQEAKLQDRWDFIDLEVKGVPVTKTHLIKEESFDGFRFRGTLTCTSKEGTMDDLILSVKNQLFKIFRTLSVSNIVESPVLVSDAKQVKELVGKTNADFFERLNHDLVRENNKPLYKIFRYHNNEQTCRKVMNGTLKVKCLLPKDLKAIPEGELHR